MRKPIEIGLIRQKSYYIILAVFTIFSVVSCGNFQTGSTKASEEFDGAASQATAVDATEATAIDATEATADLELASGYDGCDRNADNRGRHYGERVNSGRTIKNAKWYVYRNPHMKSYNHLNIYCFNNGKWLAGVQGAIQKKYQSLGAERGWLGFPRGFETDYRDGRFSCFDHGAIFWNRSKNSIEVWGGRLAHCKHLF